MIKGLNLTAKFICGYKMALAILIHYNRNVHPFTSGTLVIVNVFSTYKTQFCLSIWHAVILYFEAGYIKCTLRIMNFRKIYQKSENLHF